MLSENQQTSNPPNPLWERGNLLREKQKDMIKSIGFVILLLLLTIRAGAQVAWLEPPNPPVDDTVTLFYDANKGNKELAGWKGDVYLRTGVITNKSIDGDDWKHVIGNWGKDDKRVKMTARGNGIFSFTFVIKNFYGLRDDETAQQLAFVFRNRDGSKVGKTRDNENILVPVNGFVPPVKKAPRYLLKTRKYLSHKENGSRLNVLTDHGLVRIIPFTPTIVEVKNFQGNKPVHDSSSAVILQPVIVKTHLKETAEWLKLSTDSLEVLLHKNPFFIAYRYHGDTILKEKNGFFRRTDNDGLQFEIGKQEKLYGLGERAIDFSLNGNRYNLYNRPKYGYGLPAKNLNYSIPLLVSSKHYLLFFDNPEKGYADLGETNKNILEWGAIGGLMKYFFIAAPGFYNLSQQWALLTGRQPLPPRWALGNLQSRMAYRTQKETDSIVHLMQAKDFPVDAVIIDFYWFGDSIKGTMGRLKWYKPNWPDPKGMISNFRKKGVKTILITEPYIIDSLKNFKIADSLHILATDSTGKTYIDKGFYFGYAGLIDIFKPAAQQWFWQQYVKQIKIGVAGWWGDLGEPENHPSDMFHVNGSADEVHNIYAQYWHKMLFDNYRKYYPSVRLLNLNRTGFAGSQRYSIYPWTGDVSRSWDGLQAQLPLMLHMSMSGLPFIHSDAGGFAQGTKDDELYTRWLQMSCFSPILRPHGSGIPSEPVYFSRKTQDIVRHFMKLRYSLLPYIYTTASQANVMGYPIVRPLFYDFQDDTATYNISGEYMFGPVILVHPIINQGAKEVEVYLPGNRWYSFWNDEPFEGGQWLKMKTELETIPLFVKEGSFIPMVKPVKSTDYYSSKELTVRYYPGSTGDTSRYTMFEDDGKTFGTIKKGEFELLHFTGIKTSPHEFQLTMQRNGQDYEGRPETRKMKVAVIGLIAEAEYKVHLNGKKIKPLKAPGTTGFYFDKNGRFVIVFEWDGRMTEIIIRKK